MVWATGTPPEVAARLAALGIPVVSIPTRSLEDVAVALETLGELAGTGDVAARAAAEYRAGIAELRERYRSRAPLRVFIQIDDAPLFTVGGSHLMSEIVELCGGQNVFADAGAPALPVDLESVLARAPQAILSTDDGDPRQYWARFDGLAAVATGSVTGSRPLRDRPRSGRRRSLCSSTTRGRCSRGRRSARRWRRCLAAGSLRRRNLRSSRRSAVRPTGVAQFATAHGAGEADGGPCAVRKFRRHERPNRLFQLFFGSEASGARASDTSLLTRGARARAR